MARVRSDPARPGHFIPHHLGDPSQCAADRIQGFPVSPSPPHFRLLRRGQPRATSSHHETSILGSCCTDSLNAPSFAALERSVPLEASTSRFATPNAAVMTGTRIHVGEPATLATLRGLFANRGAARGRLDPSTAMDVSVFTLANLRARRYRAVAGQPLR